MLELNGFYNMDCMEGMKEFPDKYFELAIVDPPYGLGDRLVDGGHKKTLWKNIEKTMKAKDGTRLQINNIFANCLGLAKIK